MPLQGGTPRQKVHGLVESLPRFQRGHWLRFIGFPLDDWPALVGYLARLRSHPVLAEVAALERKVPNAFEAARPGVI